MLNKCNYRYVFWPCDSENRDKGELIEQSSERIDELCCHREAMSHPGPAHVNAMHLSPDIQGISLP